MLAAPLKFLTVTCWRCLGDGKLATDDAQSPWRYVAKIPLESAAAVLLGLVRPVDCYVCGGSGRLLECPVCGQAGTLPC